ncbi:MAG: hypothetical protein EXR73_01810 [Myxococcales bacterium]|nr:hypothetical protein [Myxococcales bacterium]
MHAARGLIRWFLVGTTLSGAAAACSSPDDPPLAADGAVTTDGTVPADGTGARRTRIYATLVSHNEDDLNAPCARGLFGLDGPATGPMAGQTVPPRDRYLAVRAATVGFAEMIVETGAAYDLQSDYPFLDAVDRYDDATVTTDTDGKNLIEWLATFAPDRVVVDPHSHEHGYGGDPLNIADTAAFVAELSGLPTTGVLGGFIASPVVEENWTQFLDGPLRAVRTRSNGYEWAPRVLWGGASPNHTEDSEISGVWRPASAESFDQHNPQGPMPNIGVWGGPVGTATGLDELLALLRAGSLEAGQMYTVTIMSAQCSLDQARIDEVRAIITAHAADVAAGDLVWATLPEVRRAWVEDYDGVPTMLHRMR